MINEIDSRCLICPFFYKLKTSISNSNFNWITCIAVQLCYKAGLLQLGDKESASKLVFYSYTAKSKQQKSSFTVRRQRVNFKACPLQLGDKESASKLVFYSYTAKSKRQKSSFTVRQQRVSFKACLLQLDDKESASKLAFCS